MVREIAPAVEIDLVEYGASNQFFEIVRELDPEPTFLCVGSLCYRKGIDILAKAFADPRLSHCRLKVLGDGPMRGELEACGDNVELLGRVGPEKVKELLGSCWALIHPTRADTSPNSVKEARVAGMAIITTQHGGQAQYVEDGESGYFFEVEDPDSLVGAILEVAENSEKALSLGLNQNEEYRELLSPMKTAVSFMDLYRKRIGSMDENR
ncbi:glycosyltransferase family 4 protein [bacterium]|nr:glycosyltransferase family 4 protein [bacterium]